MPWIKLTDLSDNPVQLSVDQIVRVRVPSDGEVDAKGKAAVDLSNGQMQAVAETVDQVMRAILK